MSTTIDQLQKTLRLSGFSLTTPRRTIFAILEAAEPLTMHELVARCPDIDRASIYRTVLLFERLGILQRLQMGWKYKLELTDSFVHHHHHLSCTSCGRIIPLPEDKNLENRLHALASTHDFQPQDHQLEIRGLCQACQTSA